jgi:hypothetical protein
MGAACSSPTPDVIATATASGGEGGGSGSELQIPRGRVAVVDGKLVTDIGTPLRGAVLAVDIDFKLDDFEMLGAVAKTSGLNAVHVYLENADLATGVKRDLADALVSLSAQAGLYVVIGYGGGRDNGQFVLEKLRAFWTLYAARYADSSHVLFEIQNNPEVVCDAPLNAATIAMEREIYGLIRALAPQTHVLLHSLSAIPTAAMVQDSIDRVSDVVDWSNASIAFHAETDCVPIAGLETSLSPARAAHVAVTFNQLPTPTGWEQALSQAELSGLGWFQHRWFTTKDDTVSTFRQAIVAAGLSWCPDQGDFPLDSETCR